MGTDKVDDLALLIYTTAQTNFLQLGLEQVVRGMNSVKTKLTRFKKLWCPFREMITSEIARPIHKPW